MTGLLVAHVMATLVEAIGDDPAMNNVEVATRVEVVGDDPAMSNLEVAMLNVRARAVVPCWPRRSQGCPSRRSPME